MAKEKVHTGNDSINVHSWPIANMMNRDRFDFVEIAWPANANSSKSSDNFAIHKDLLRPYNDAEAVAMVLGIVSLTRESQRSELIYLRSVPHSWFFQSSTPMLLVNFCKKRPLPYDLNNLQLDQVFQATLGDKWIALVPLSTVVKPVLGIKGSEPINIVYWYCASSLHFLCSARRWPLLHAVHIEVPEPSKLGHLDIRHSTAGQ